MNFRAQGAIEYLLIIAAVVLVSVVVISVLPSLIQKPDYAISSVDNSLGVLRGKSTSPVISIIDSLIDPNTDSTTSIGHIDFNSTNGSDINISTITVNGAGASFSSGGGGGGGGSQSVTWVVDNGNCDCSSGASSVMCRVVINFSNGQVASNDVNFACVQNSVDLFNRGSDGGDGSLAKPWKIITCVDLQKMNTKLNNNYVLSRDVNCSATKNWNSLNGFLPVGSVGSGQFSGSLNGANHKISGLYINRSSLDDVGLFGYSSGKISNVFLKDVAVIGGNYVGGLVGRNSGFVSGSYSTGVLSGVKFVGGLIGNNSGFVSGSFATGNVTGTNVYVGGLIGQNNVASVSNSYADTTVSGLAYVGGLIGEANSGSVSGSYASGVVTGNSFVGGLVGRGSSVSLSEVSFNGVVNSLPNGTNTGGIVGELSGAGNAVGKSQIVKANFSGTINSTTYYGGSPDPVIGGVGGIVGYSGDSYSIISKSVSTGTLNVNTNGGGIAGSYEGVIVDSFFNGNIAGTGGNRCTSCAGWIGGLLGKGKANISNSYSSGVVTGAQGGNIGGAVGYLSIGGVLQNVYSVATVSNTSGSSSNTGGLVGSNLGSIINSFFTDLTFVNGLGSLADSQSLFYGSSHDVYTVDPVWDFESTWQSNSSNYPTLK